MLIDDVRKIEELKQKIDENPKYIEEIEKLEKKYVSVEGKAEGVKVVYMDKHKNKVVVLKSGEIFQINGPDSATSPRFMGYLMAYMIFGLTSLLLTIMSASNSTLIPIAKAMDALIIPGGIILNILCLVMLRKTFMQHKILMFLTLFLLGYNVFRLFT